MSRGIRKFSDSGVYHVVFRGVNKQNIFLDDFDFNVMLSYIRDVKNKLPFELYAFCLMSNHVHMLVHEHNVSEISQIMKKILVKYALYFNNKYNRCGHLFESRYKSKPVDSNDYLFASLRYIHQNPVKASLVEKPEDYSWSSYSEYINNTDMYTDKEFILQIIDIKHFKKMHEENVDDFDPFNEKEQRLNKLRKYIQDNYGVKATEIAGLTLREKRVIFEDLLQRYSCSDISSVTMINRSTIFNYKSK